MMDKNLQKLNYAQGDLLKGIFAFQNALKDAARECTIYKNNYKDYLKSGGDATAETERLKNRVSVIQDAIHHLKQQLDW